MSEPEDFLSRWSRRKRENAEPAKPAAPDAARDAAAEAAPKPDVAKAAPEAEPFDISSLPPIESIGPDSDITAFLARGVPADLTRAALRRAWTADPAIRDFVGLAENAWDFTAPDSMPGFGPLLPTDDVKRMVAQVFSRDGIEPETSPETQVEAEGRTSAAQQMGSNNAPEPTELGDKSSQGEQQNAEASQEQPNNAANTAQNNTEKSGQDIAVQQAGDADEDRKVPPRRPHGSALPS